MPTIPNLTGGDTTYEFGEDNALLKGSSATKLTVRNNADNADGDLQVDDLTVGGSISLPNNKLSDLSISISDALNNSATDVPASANAIKVVNDKVVVIETALHTDNTLYDTLGERVTALVTLVSDLDTAEATIVSLTSNKANLSGAAFTGDTSILTKLTVPHVLAPANLKLEATGNDVTFKGGNKEIFKVENVSGGTDKTKITIHGGSDATKELEMFCTVNAKHLKADDVSVNDLATRTNKHLAARSITVTKDSTSSANFGTTLKAGSCTEWINIKVDEEFNGDSYIVIGNDSDDDAYLTIAHSQLGVGLKQPSFQIPPLASDTQLKIQVKSTSSAADEGSAILWFTPSMKAPS